MKENPRKDPKACDICDTQKVILLTLANGLQICPGCRKAKV
jgi:hypothetical protein